MFKASPRFGHYLVHSINVVVKLLDFERIL